MTFDDGLLTTAVARPDGRFRAGITIPADAPPGDHEVQVIGETSGFIGQNTFTVRTDWPQYRFDGGHTGFNPLENVISSGNVGSLTQAWEGALVSYEAPDPVISDGVVYAISSFGLAKGFDPASGAQVWSCQVRSLTNGDAPAIVDGIFYTGTLNGDVVAIDLATSEQRWTVPLEGPMFHSVTVSGGMVYAQAEGAGVVALDARTGALVWSNPDIDAATTAAIANGLLFVADWDENLWALDPSSGDVIWRRDLPCCPLNSELVAGEGVVAVGLDQTVRVYDWQTGQFLWTGDIATSARTPALANGLVYVVSGESHYGAVQAFDIETGNEVWETDLPDWLGAEPVVANGVVYLGAYDDRMYGFDAITGEQLWQSSPLNIDALGSPAIADGVVYGSDIDGGLFAFALP